MDDKKTQLENLIRELEEDRSLPLGGANLVFGEGSLGASVIFIGEAPGFFEDQQRRPFVGRAGQLLTKLIGEIGWKRDDVYITNIIKRRPPENRDPLQEEISAYAPYLVRQIEIINPKIVVTLGRISMSYFFPAGKITRDQGKVFRLRDGKLLVPMFHPAAALRSAGTMRLLEQSFKKLPLIVEKHKELIQNNSITSHDTDATQNKLL